MATDEVGFGDLPFDFLVEEVNRCLKPSARLCFSWTCRRFLSEARFSEETLFGPRFLDVCVQKGYFTLFKWAFEAGCLVDEDVIMKVKSCPSIELVDLLHSLVKSTATERPLMAALKSPRNYLYELLDFQRGVLSKSNFKKRFAEALYPPIFLFGLAKQGGEGAEKGFEEICPLSDGVVKSRMVCEDAIAGALKGDNINLFKKYHAALHKAASLSTMKLEMEEGKLFFEGEGSQIATWILSTFDHQKHRSEGDRVKKIFSTYSRRIRDYESLSCVPTAVISTFQKFVEAEVVHALVLSSALRTCNKSLLAGIFQISKPGDILVPFPRIISEIFDPVRLRTGVSLEILRLVIAQVGSLDGFIPRLSKKDCEVICIGSMALGDVDLLDFLLSSGIVTLTDLGLSSEMTLSDTTTPATDRIPSTKSILWLAGKGFRFPENFSLTRVEFLVAPIRDLDIATLRTLLELLKPIRDNSVHLLRHCLVVMKRKREPRYYSEKLFGKLLYILMEAVFPGISEGELFRESISSVTYELNNRVFY